MRRLLPVLATTMVLACAPGADVAPDSGVDAGDVGQGGEASADLVINELSPPDDWIELMNRSESTIDLAAYFITDSVDRLDHYLALDGQLSPGELIVIEPETFGLSAIEEVHLLTTTGLYVDGLSYYYDSPDDTHSIARQPNGQGPFYLSSPSPGEDN